MNSVSDLKSVIKDEAVQSLLLNYSKKAKKPLSRSEVLNYFSPQAAGTIALSSAIGTKLGIKCVNERKVTVKGNTITVAIAILCALLAEGIEPSSLGEGNLNDLRIYGTVPSANLTHNGGVIETTLKPNSQSLEIHFKVILPGQWMAWGAGSRMLSRIIEQIYLALTEIHSVLPDLQAQ